MLNLIISAGFFVFNHAVFQYMAGDKQCTIEPTLLKKLTAIDELAVYKHDSCWIGIDTYKDLLNARQNAHWLEKL